METNATKRTDIFQIDPRNIVVMDDFNARRDFDLEELKEQIKAKGVLNPITVLPFKDEDGIERYKLVDGERRYRATMLAIEEGTNIPYIKALKLPKDTSTEELLIEQMMRNEGKTQNEIAEKFKKSPAFVSKCLSLMDLPIEIQERIINKQISASAAKDIVANYDTEEEQVNATRKAVELAEKQGKRTVTNKEINAVQKEAKEAKEIAQALRKVWAYLDGGVMVDVDKLAILLDKTESLSNAMKQYKKLSK